MQFEPNKLVMDDFGRRHGILLIDKPAGITSHDVVDQVRRALGTTKVGHAGALDPFATGILIIMVGKATKLSDSFLNLDKSYIADVLFGVETDSGDPEGIVLRQNPEPKEMLNQTELDQVLNNFKPEYKQTVPVFSSIKINGEKLRELARKHARFEVIETEDGKTAQFFDAENHLKKEVKLPVHTCKIYNIGVLNTYNFDIERLNLKGIDGIPTYPVAQILVSCSKGTYIRTLASDIGAKLNPPLPAMLIELQRTKIGDYGINDAWSLAQLREAYPTKQSIPDVADE